MSRYNYFRRKSSVAKAGNVEIGGENPIRVQSMTNTSTLDTEGSVAQAIRIAEAGGEIVRLTTRGVREAENMAEIRKGLDAAGVTCPWWRMCISIRMRRSRPRRPVRKCA